MSKLQKEADEAVAALLADCDFMASVVLENGFKRFKGHPEMCLNMVAAVRKDGALLKATPLDHIGSFMVNAMEKAIEKNPQIKEDVHKYLLEERPASVNDVNNWVNTY